MYSHTHQTEQNINHFKSVINCHSILYRNLFNYATIKVKPKQFTHIGSGQRKNSNENVREGLRKKKYKQFILVHLFSKTTSSLSCHTNKESFTKTFNCTITINHTVLTSCRNQEHPWIKELHPAAPIN